MTDFGYAATNGSQWPPLPSKAAGMYSVTILLLFTIAKERESLQTDIKILSLLRTAQAHLHFPYSSAGRLVMG